MVDSRKLIRMGRRSSETVHIPGRKPLTAKEKLQNLADELVKDIDALSDEELLSEAMEDGIDLLQIKADFQNMLKRLKHNA
jgi:hypothetical protein